MNIAVDPQSGVDPYEQIRTQIADQIRAGVLPPQGRLPSIRQLAADLRVAPGTVAKAYALLAEESLIETSRTRGTRVAEDQAHPLNVQAAAARYVGAVGQVGLDEALSAVRAAWVRRYG